MQLSFNPLTTKNWKDLELLFGKNGACAGCWCMYWIMPRKEYDVKRKDGRTKSEMKKIVKKNLQPGILAYDNDIPVGWIAIQPRDNYLVLANSRVLKPVDDKKVWSIVCFFTHKDYRRKGLSTELIKNAVLSAKKRGAKIVEGYPIHTKNKNTAPVFIYTGTYSAYVKAGFKEVARRSETRPIMRFKVK